MFIPHSEEETRSLLAELGLGSLEDLFSHIEGDLLTPPTDLPPPLSEEEVRRFFRESSEKNKPLICFAGAGSYDRIIPSAVLQLIERGEFLTAYTPYQAEASQGTLQAIFEYQSLICELTGMDVANASMYDGASALAEAVLMVRSLRGKSSGVALSLGVNPFYRETVETYLGGSGDRIRSVSITEEGTTDLNELEEVLREGGVYAVAVQYPNFLGFVEPLKEIEELTHRYEALLIVVADPIALAVLKPPGELGADVVVGEGQQLGVPMSFGGPYVGFFSAREEFLRRMPGRLVGLAEDTEGNRAFTLVLQTREQHIRRERATSNICTNQNLLALANLIYLCLMGREGLREVARQSLSKAFFLKERLRELGFEDVFGGKHLWEFPLRIPGAKKVWRKLLERGFMLGIPLEKHYPFLKESLLIAVTEKRTRGEMEELLEVLGGLLT